MKTYKYDAQDKLTDNLKVSEFRCKCGKQHDTPLDENLPVMIQKVADILGAEHIYISSGYRCAAHDKAVGGTGYGLHTKGYAADFALSKDGKYIDPRVIAAVAQEVGFGGIGRINTQYIHCDTRTSNLWMGDEYLGATNYSLFKADANTYWNYYKLNRADYIKEPVKTIETRLQECLIKMGEKITSDGIIGANTLNAMRRHVIAKGDKGDFVKVVQELLNSKGYDCGTPDGVAGDKTVQAVNNAAWDKLLAKGETK